ncbi:Zn-dependent protease with chaperone function [Tenacibaculum sp. MAR_2009_124]|uniref:M48 family metallopeptidase n=1 Tax=Tenacibaculum sp. MAR_2009_124 TaxID=1250059 RepID=UPI000897A473|nr:M48 family metallopeptidase [Tenacibaculum sp. MAR_2009_124]SED14792.1 Zn-dependent protease with chaperone function [Tenacibaculum sp. MAR_2009_124]
MIAVNYYPKSPKGISKNFTKLPSSYITKSILAIIAIILFFVLYACLVFATGYLAYIALIYDIGQVNKATILMKIGAVAGSAMLFVFTLKFIFKLKNPKPQNRIKLNKTKHQNLWNFVIKICEETGAPKPKNIFIDPDVNAYVAYSNIWLSLFLPIKKELTIGLGLIDSLNLTEFKAVITHEFGHFAQKAMKIGSYINSANTIIHDMIYNRDSWDNLLDEWRASDIRLSFAAWIITPVIWIIRQTLALFYQFLNIMYSSLSREMEFNADKVAVSTSGSDAIIAALWKLDVGFENWNNTIEHAYLASKKKVFTKNLYTHNQIAHDKVKDSQLEKLTNLPKHSMGGKKYFSSSENSKVSMYASHPPNNLRQENAKSPYIECGSDDRSPWLLFEKANELQEEMTLLVYKQYIGKESLEFSTSTVFENFIIQEMQGKELLAEYQDTFLNRFLFIDAHDELLKRAKEREAVYQNDITYLKESLTTLMNPVKEIENLMNKAVEISQGTTKDVSFNFQGKEYNKKDLQEGYETMVAEREKIFNENFKDWDTRFCAIHLNLAIQNNKQDELLKIYKQHQVIIEIYKGIVAVKNTIFEDLQQLQTKSEVEQSEIAKFISNVKQLTESNNTILDAIDKIEFIPMSNIDDVQEFKEAIVDDGIFRKEEGNLLENGGFDKTVIKIDNAINNCQRIEQKSIGLILMFHHQLHEKVKAFN